MYVVVVCTFLILFYFFDYLKWRKRYLLPISKLPGRKRYPIVGTRYIYLGIPKEKLFDFFSRDVASMPPIFCAWDSATPEINLRKAEHLEIIMNNSEHITKGNLYHYLSAWLGDGLLISTGAKWHKHRKLITPAFHFKILENYMGIFEKISKILLEQLEKEGNHYFDIYPYITHCSLDIICETAMGIGVNAMQSCNSEYVKSVYGLCDLIIWRVMRPYIGDTLFYLLPQGRAFKKYRKVLHSFSYKVIDDRKKILQKNNNTLEVNRGNSINKKTKLSFLDLLLEASKNGTALSDQNIREEVDTFMFEGHDTTTASIAWTIFLLGNNIDIQNKVFSELQAVLGEKMIPSTLEELNQLKYLERAIKESLRLYPSVVLSQRIIGKDVVIDGYEIPKGVQAILHIYQVHRDSEYFPDPEKFDPDRFLPENSEKRHPYSYIPFSAGLRNCIGQKFAMYEEKTVLAAIIKNFEIKSRETPETVKLVGDVILRPFAGINVMLRKRRG